MPNTKSTLTVPARHPARLHAAAVAGAAAAAVIETVPPGDERPEADWGAHVTDEEYHGR